MSLVSIIKNIMLMLFIALLAQCAAMAQISGTFIQADATNTVPVDAIAIKSYADGYDAKWTPTAWGNVIALTSYAKFDVANNLGEDCPQLKTTITNLDPSKSYKIYTQLLCCYGGNWAIYTNLPGQTRKLLTINNTTNTGLTYDGTNPICEYELGVVSGVTSCSVSIDDYSDSTAFAISAYYGVSYEEIVSTRSPGFSGTFVKADATNTTPASAIVNKTYADGYDAKWTPMTWGNITALTSYAKFDPANNLGENCPALTTTVSGLDAAKTYDIYIDFPAMLDGNWAVYAGLSGQSKTLVGLANSVSTGLTIDGTNPICEHKLGTIQGATSFSVAVDDYNDSQYFTLSVYYGVSYTEQSPVAAY